MSSERHGLTSVWRELTSATRELTSERRDVTSNLWGAPIGTVEVISERYGATARREEARGEQRAVADELRCVPAIGEDVLVARQSANRARDGVVTVRSDVSPARCE